MTIKITYNNGDSYITTIPNESYALKNKITYNNGDSYITTIPNESYALKKALWEAEVRTYLRLNRRRMWEGL